MPVHVHTLLIALVMPLMTLIMAFMPVSTIVIMP